MPSKRYATVFDAIADTPQEAVNLRLRAEVMQRIAQRTNARAGHNAKLPDTGASPSHA